MKIQSDTNHHHLRRPLCKCRQWHSALLAFGALILFAAAAATNVATADGTHLRKRLANHLESDQTFDSRRLSTVEEGGGEGSFAPITAITVVYKDEPCPPEYTMVQQNLNAGTNGDAVHLCYKRRGKEASNEEVVTEITLLSGSRSCPQGFDPVKNAGSSDTANLNQGARRWFLWWETTKVITMCYRKGVNTCDGSSDGECSGIYQLRTANQYSVFGLTPVVSRWFERLDQNLNEGVGGANLLYLAYSHSPSFVAGAVALAEGSCPWFSAAWSSAQEGPNGDITVEVVLDCQLNGGDDDNNCFGADPMEETEFERLCQVAREGIEQNWSGPVTVLGVTRNVVVTTVERDHGTKKDINICMCGEEYGDENFCPGSENHQNSDWDGLLPDMTIWYSKNDFHSQSKADEVYKRVAAHEIGHSFLYDYKDLIYSWGHKNTTSFIPYAPFPTPPCPESGETLDLMKVYAGDCWLGFDLKGTFNQKYSAEVVEWDRASMLMTVGDYAYSYSGPD